MSKIEKRISRENVVKVTVPVSVAYDAKKMQKITETVLGRLGCVACHSGFDIRFQYENPVFRFDEKLRML